MYTVCWIDVNGRDRWERCESRREVASLLIKLRLDDDPDVLIFGPDADDCILTPEDIFAAI